MTVYEKIKGIKQIFDAAVASGIVKDIESAAHMNNLFNEVKSDLEHYERMIASNNEMPT